MSWATDSGSTTLATFSYNPLSRLTNISDMGGGAATVDLTYSNAGDPLTLTHNLSGTVDDNTFTYTYTNAHQTASLAASNAVWQWAPATTSTTSYAAVNVLNQYTTVGSATLSYDTRGNLTGDGTWTYAFDAENRLLTANKAGGTVAATYAYDVLGRRTKKSGTGVTTTYFLSDGSDEIVEYGALGAVLRKFVPGVSIDHPIAMIQSGAKTFFHTDRLGSVVEMTSTTGARTEGPYTYDPYGQPSATTGEPFKFTGRRLDAETGLYYYRARYYSALLGRFLQTDAIGYEDNLNLYAYVGNDSTNAVDPTGDAQVCVTDISTGAVSCSGDEEDAQFLLRLTLLILDNSPPGIIACATILCSTSTGDDDTCGPKGCQPSLPLSDKSGTAATPPGPNNIDPDDDENKRNHIFGKTEHNLDKVVEEQGGEKQAYQAIKKAVEQPARSAAGAGGRFQVTVRVGSQNVTVRGAIQNNQVRIGTAYVVK